MSSFSFTKKLNSDDPNIVHITLSPEVADKFIKLFREHYETQLSQGEQNVLPDGQIELLFELDDEEAQKLKTAFMYAYSLESGHQTPN